MLRMRGMSLVEMVITIVIISVALVGSLRAFSVLTGRSADVLIQTRSADLAQLYFDEILSRRYDEATGTNGVPAYTGACRITNDGESRDNYDDVDDYYAVTNESPDTMDASLATDYSGYTVSINVVCDDSIGVNTGGAKRIEITIDDPIGATSVFSMYKGNY